MFGYVRFDKPYLYFKDYDLYQASYCGVCKALGVACGQASRLGLSYDAAFLNVLCHNLTGVDFTVERHGCFTKFGVKRPMAAVDELSKKVACLNTDLVYFKLCDDVIDEKKGGFKRFALRGNVEKSKRLHPRLYEIVQTYMQKQQRIEEEKCDSLDRAAHSTALMIQEAGDYLLGDAASDASRQLFYDIGKWIYLIDGLDDIEKDVKKGCYNPYVLAYGCKSKAQLKENGAKDVEFIFNTLFFSMREALSKLKFYFNRDLVDNVLLRGIPKVTQEVMQGRLPQKQGKRETEKSGK